MKPKKYQTQKEAIRKGATGYIPKKKKLAIFNFGGLCYHVYDYYIVAKGIKSSQEFGRPAIFSKAIEYIQMPLFRGRMSLFEDSMLLDDIRFDIVDKDKFRKVMRKNICELRIISPDDDTFNLKFAFVVVKTSNKVHYFSARNSFI